VRFAPALVASPKWLLLDLEVFPPQEAPLYIICANEPIYAVPKFFCWVSEVYLFLGAPTATFFGQQMQT
jgi:hypothetical protein